MSAALDPGGVIWLAGTWSDSCVFDQNGPAGPSPNGFFVASMTLDGKLETVGSVTGGSVDRPPVVARDGSIYLAGSLSQVPGQQGPIDVDPSAGVSNVVVPDKDSLTFAMKLDHDGKLRWLQPVDVSVGTFGSMALTPDDGLILAGEPGAVFGGISVVRLDADGHEVWQLRPGSGSTSVTSVLVNATGFFLLGEENGPADLDPSTGVDMHDGELVFLSNYTF
jgi:hypothetical protein